MDKKIEYLYHQAMEENAAGNLVPNPNPESKSKSESHLNPCRFKGTCSRMGYQI